ncbi:SIR2 family NAD-dependent protein deacylase [Leptothoe spongobia]|uniref:SIR2 family protein n=1 Tax=Leptothoe spongobia TAU-MAC 1115 TaxID=1967444 RepID=A0A947DHM3_9CYAN|nr:SIR2 family protein [Leptothoe spongobia]MBT9316071.1 SIR2 family protein [Leptothoe spongobia TAU-MAC 1115]
MTQTNLEEAVRQPNRLLNKNCENLIQGIIEGKIVPVLGREHNLCDRPKINQKPEFWQCDFSLNPPSCPSYPPTHRELAAYLIEYFTNHGAAHFDEIQFSYPFQGIESGKWKAEWADLQHVFQLLCDAESKVLATSELHRILCDKNYRPNQLHKSFALLPKVIRLTKPDAPMFPLIVTTSYDRMLEQAFEAAEEPFDLVYYSATGEKDDWFLHKTPEGIIHEIDNPNNYRRLSLKKRPVILKVYGTVDQSIDADRLVISEDDYIDFLSWRNTPDLLPTTLLKQLRRNQVLFLGPCSLSHWHQRVILHHIWPTRPFLKKSKWYAIQWDSEESDDIKESNDINKKFWKKYNVDIQDISPEDFMNEFDEQIHSIIGGQGK